MVSKDGTGLIEGADLDPEKERKQMLIRIPQERYMLLRDLAAESNISLNDLLLKLIDPALEILVHVRGGKPNR